MVISKRYFVTGITAVGELAYARVKVEFGDLIIDNTNLDCAFSIFSIGLGYDDIEERIIEVCERELGLIHINIKYLDLIKK